MGRGGVNKCFTQQLPPMQVRAEIAEADPALPVLPLDLCASSLLRGRAEIPKSLLTAGCRDRAEVQSEKLTVPFGEKHTDSFSLWRERLQTHPKSTYYYHSKQPLPFFTASSSVWSLKNHSSLFAVREAPNTSNSQLTHLQSHYPLYFQGSNLGSDWGQACLIKYEKPPFVQSSTKICILKKPKIPTILKSDKFQLSCKGLQCPVLTAPASQTELPAHIPKFTPPATSCFRKLSRTEL